MNRLIQILALAILVVPALALGETKRGDVKLQESEFGPPKGAPVVELGKTLKMSVSMYIGEFFGSKVIHCQPRLKNTGDKPMHGSVHVAFFDKDGNLVGASSQTTMGDDGIKPGEETQLGSLMIQLPPDALAKVATYQVTFYESEKKI
jgi:hypothetical protein